MTVTPNDVLRFALELAGIVATGYWGYHATDHPVGRLVLAVGAPLVLIVAWALVVAPNATNSIPAETRFLIGSGLLLLAAGGLFLAGQTPAGVIFAGLVVVNTVLHRIA